MCGILLHIKQSKFRRSDVENIISSLQLIDHRGPDGEGVVFLNTLTGEKWTLRTRQTPAQATCNGSKEDFPEGVFNLCMAHKRLSIFDLSFAGHQPFFDENGNAIIFNGEVYNFKELKNDLISNGYGFKTQTDTEVILHAYHLWKEKAFARFNGMFSFIIWDNNLKKLLVANDRFGVKPLYYYEDSDQKIFTSELKQFLPFDIPKEFNFKKITDCIKYDLIDHDYETMLQNIYRFPNAHYSSLSYYDAIKPRKYYEIESNIYAKDFNDEKKSFSELFKNAVSIRLRADVPWGICASGGLDSSIVLYTADQIQKDEKSPFRVKTFSAISPGYKEDESEFIKYIENDLGIDSYYTNTVKEFDIEDFKKHIWHLDGPVLSSSYYAQWKVSKLARESGVTVLLVGQGADEMFAGYHQHFYRYCRYLLEKLQLGTLKKEINSYTLLKDENTSRIWKIVVNELKLKYKALTGLQSFENDVLKQKYATADIYQLLQLDFKHAMLPYYLRAEDRMAMAFSVETRHPFLDYRVVNHAFRLPINYKIKDGWQKAFLRQTFDCVPEKLRFRKDKKGFSTPEEQIQKELEKYYPVTDDVKMFCKENGILQCSNNISVQSLSLWMNMIKKGANNI